ncbi:hypothetical protein F11_01530 [Rhodospirillum rubrum F11]|nr:hypothetical protein F11_01530 [Rhodospirillum rubrum F11]
MLCDKRHNNWSAYFLTVNTTTEHYEIWDRQNKCIDKRLINDATRFPYSATCIEGVTIIMDLRWLIMIIWYFEMADK